MKLNLLYVLFIFIVACSPSKHLVQVEFADNPVIAHRGAFKKNNLPENSIAALKEAIRLRCTGSEFDVRMTLDDTLIINHDPHYNGLEIEKTNYKDLSKIPLSNGEMLPT